MKSKEIEIAEKYPLIKEGYDVLECPRCNKVCYPEKKLLNDTIKYNTHKCHPYYIADHLIGYTKRASFKIDSNGDIIENKYF